MTIRCEAPLNKEDKMAKERIRERAGELRKRAEKILAEEPQPIRTMVPADIQKLIYELNVHQIELEMQNAELRRVQLELQEARDKYLNLYDFAPTGYFTLDHNSLIVDVNLAGSELLGSEKHRLIGAQFNSSISPDSQDAFYFHYREMLKTGIKGNCELKMLKADGTPFHAQVISMAVPEKDANINQCRTAVIDITERKRAEEAQERLRQQLQAKVSELETFSYGIAHDLRSPLVSIEGFSRLLQDDMLNQDTEKVQEDIRLLESSVRKMQQFLNRTLEYSRAGYQIKLAKNVSFGKIVNEAIAEFNGQISSIGAAVSRADKFPRVYADKVRIAEVLTNLIQNSINYRDKTVPLKIEIGYRLSEGEVVFFVRDNGTGIEKSETEKVFDLFYRGSTEGEGSGAGLAIVKKITEAHGGRIWVQEGQSGKGTTMCFTLPKQGGTNKGDNNGKD